jgi:hypothetical protein
MYYIQLAQHCQKFLDDLSLRFAPYVVQPNVSPDAFSFCMEIFDGVKPNFSLETFADLVLLAPEFGYHHLIASLAP